MTRVNGWDLYWVILMWLCAVRNSRGDTVRVRPQEKVFSLTDIVLLVFYCVIQHRSSSVHQSHRTLLYEWLSSSIHNHSSVSLSWESYYCVSCQGKWYFVILVVCGRDGWEWSTSGLGGLYKVLKPVESWHEMTIHPV